jgi:hypothetical protein
MVDLQRGFSWIRNTACRWMQGVSRNSDTIALTDSNRSQIFSKPDSAENFIRSHFSKSITVAPGMKPKRSGGVT